MQQEKNRLSIYSLDHLKPEVVAVAFAKCSRSADSFKDIADELTDEKSADFHEKWVVGYICNLLPKKSRMERLLVIRVLLWTLLKSNSTN